MNTYRYAFNPRQPRTPMMLATPAGSIICRLRMAHRMVRRECTPEDLADDLGDL